MQFCEMNQNARGIDEIELDISYKDLSITNKQGITLQLMGLAQEIKQNFVL